MAKAALRKIYTIFCRVANADMAEAAVNVHCVRSGRAGEKLRFHSKPRSLC
jgi:hypothetical protein